MQNDSNPTTTHRIGDSATITHSDTRGTWTSETKLVNIKSHDVFGTEGPFGVFCDVRMLAERPNHTGGSVIRLDDPCIVWTD